MTKIVNIAKNTSYLTLALIFQKVISFTYFTLLARYVGPADLGKYYLAISFTSIFSIFIDIGLSNVLTREVAKDQEKAVTWLGNIVSIKTILSGLMLLIVFILANVLNFDPLTKTLIYVSAISMVFDSFAGTFYSVIRGFHNLKFESIGSIVFQLIVLTLGYSALLSGGGLLLAMSALAVASTFNFIFSASILKYRLKVAIRALYNRVLIKSILTIAWPFATYAILQTLYTYLDSVFISILASDTQVGLYQIAFKVIFALQFLPMAFNASLYPALSTYWQTNREQLIISFERAMNYLIIISWPIVIGIFILAPKFVLLFKSSYSEAVQPLRISVIALFFIFLNYPIGSLLNACDAQRKNTKNMAIIAVSSVIANFLLIPYWQASGASFTVLFTSLLMFILGMYEIKKIITYHLKKNLLVFSKVLLSSLIMGLSIFWGQNYFNIFIVAILGGAIYFTVLFILGGFKRADIISIYQSFKKTAKPINDFSVDL